MQNERSSLTQPSISPSLSNIWLISWMKGEVIQLAVLDPVLLELKQLKIFYF
jgi:hypothetical protein